MKYVVTYKTVHEDIIEALDIKSAEAITHEYLVKRGGKTILLSIEPFSTVPPKEPANAVHQPSAA